MSHYCPDCGCLMPHPSVAAHHCPGELATVAQGAPQPQPRFSVRWADLLAFSAVCLIVGIGGGALISAWIFGP